MLQQRENLFCHIVIVPNMRVRQTLTPPTRTAGDISQDEDVGFELIGTDVVWFWKYGTDMIVLMIASRKYYNLVCVVEIEPRILPRAVMIFKFRRPSW